MKIESHGDFFLGAKTKGIDEWILIHLLKLCTRKQIMLIYVNLDKFYNVGPYWV